MAIIMSQLVQPSLLDESIDIEVRRELFRYFGTFVRGTITMFEVTLANWVPSCRLLLESVSPWYAGFYILYRCCFMFAVLKVITAVFIAETARCARNDDELAVSTKKVQKMQYVEKLKELFHHLDKDGDGNVSWEEFEPVITNPTLTTWLATLEIDTHDLMALYYIYDGKDGTLNSDRFIEGMTHVKGPAKAIDVLKVLEGVEDLSQQMNTVLTKIPT